ncbi:protein Jumonji [Cylas formicarius]|uniref:protein Jumonji n=1 Tax=Cylas formicarius TaxID=197179 RepID=UPI0029585C93|nr:protein Jumonji [Cylas formicarius]
MKLSKMKRKRRETCPSPILEEVPKRPKVQAQRKFAQGSNVNSPVITPIRDIEAADLLPRTSMPEPVELLPMKRPNTEDFLTFLCFRGTPILPPNLNFFNTASIVADGQVHEIKGESPKNGPIDITKCAGSSSEKPFIAFGVRKRADPIVISRQMDRKRRHALALQALRRKYQEQKMAKIRALTISKLSEKTTNKTLVKTNTIQKTETVTKKNVTLEKTKVVATKHVKVTTQTLKTALRPKIKSKMCLRSFRGRLVQKELPLKGRRRIISGQENVGAATTDERKKCKNEETDKSSKTSIREQLKKNDKKELLSRVTRSGSLNIMPPNLSRQKIKKRILLSSTNSVVKPKLRSTTLKKTVISQRRAKQRLSIKRGSRELKESEILVQKFQMKRPDVVKKSSNKSEAASKTTTKPESKQSENVIKKEIRKNVNIKKFVNTKTEDVEIKKNIDIKKISETTSEIGKDQKIKKEINKVVETSRKVITKKSEDKSVSEAKHHFTRNAPNPEKRMQETKKNKEESKLKSTRAKSSPEIRLKKEVRKEEEKKMKKKNEKILQPRQTKAETEKKTKEVDSKELKIEKAPKKAKEVKSKKPHEDVVIKENIKLENKEDIKEDEKLQTLSKALKQDESNKELKSKLNKIEDHEANSQKNCRPTRKTKEAAAIYMEILSHKLVNEGKIDDDNVSIDSFPELPNVKKTEQRENELKKAQAKTKDPDIEEPKNAEKMRNDKDRIKKELGKEKIDKPQDIEIELKKCENKTEKCENAAEKNVEEKKAQPLSGNKKAAIENSDSDSDDEVLQEKIRRIAASQEESVKSSPLRRPTRAVVAKSEDSDASFHIDIKVPRKKKLTRSKTKAPEKTPHTSPDPPKVEPQVSKLKESSSDESTTSDINLKSLQVKQKNKKLSKTKSSKKSSVEFSDSDEEPLSKLTTKSVKSCIVGQKQGEAKTMTEIKEVKPKRECAKRPQNYLPMLSSSEDEDEPYFHGFSTVKEEIKKPKTFVDAVVPSLDLLAKDTGRKAKVNMSNEQIEQWLKDSALAGSGIAKENDAMLKFGETIPMDLEAVPDTSMYEETKNKESIPESEIVQTKSEPKSDIKSSVADRKLIFKKDKKDSGPNLNAFSPENECSVYAFGEDAEDIISTPFRRPSRRPSSTATSRSEDESSKYDETPKPGQFRKPKSQNESHDEFRFFNVPQNPSSKIPKPLKGDSVPLPPSFQSKRPPKLAIDKFPEPFDDKYKIPSSPSASSSSSAKLYKKAAQKSKKMPPDVATPVYVSDFPRGSEPGMLVEAPVFHPTDQEFQDPLEYIERIRHKAEQFGICKIVPPTSFKPECKVSDEMRFTAYNQYIHKMLHRWGPNFKEFMAIRKYLATQNITLKHPPWIGGMEVDLPRLYQTVQSLGGLKEVIEKKRWPKVSECMKIPKSAQDRVTKLDDIYCKYLLPYDTLSPAEREKLFDEVETEWAKRESKGLLKAEETVGEGPEAPDDEYESDDEIEECIVKGRNMALNAFYRVARNTMSMHFKNTEPNAQEVEQEFWKYVIQKQNHICVHSASIDCGSWGYGFAVSKNSPFARHAWNLKVLTNNGNSVLRSLGPVMGVTVPTLHVGMVFSACCWYRDPHGLPWIEYLHTGGNKIWYGVPNSSCDQFHAALKRLVPNYCQNKELWLPSDTVMVPPNLLMENNVSLCRAVQEPGQFVVVFPKVFTSSISTGYVVSESVYFAPLYWLKTAQSLFDDLKSSCEPSMFSLAKLLLSIASDTKSSTEVLKLILPHIEELREREKVERARIRGFGNVEEEKMAAPESGCKKKKKPHPSTDENEFECDVCRMNLFVSMMMDVQNDLAYCLEHAAELLEKDAKLAESFRLRYAYEERELEGVVERINAAIDAKLQKKVPNKYAGMPTLLTK